MAGPDTTEDIERLILICKESDVHRMTWGDWAIEFFAEDDESDDSSSEMTPAIGFDAAPTQDGDGEEGRGVQRTGYDKLFGANKPVFRKPAVEG